MNYVKEIYTGTEDKLSLVPFARLTNLAYFIVHDFNKNCDVCYNLRLSKSFIESIIDKSCEIIHLNLTFEFPFKLRFYVFGVEANFVFSVNKAQSQIIKYLTLKKKICFNPQKYKPLALNSDGIESFSSLNMFCSILNLTGVDSNCFCIAYNKPIYFVYYISDLDKFKLAVIKYKIQHPNDKVIVNFANM